jgi:putative peptide zinc metalloprotease protein
VVAGGRPVPPGARLGGRPALALVLVPQTDGVPGAGSTTADGDAPTWVFPFNRPLPPGEGDNQALAVNTVDGSVRYDVSFALVWADEDTALNRNEAYALAGCRDCTTVAVAFQVVLLVGSVDVVVPENIAAAVNYACVECVTYALATQLVVSLPGPLSDDGTRQLAAIWADLQAFGEQIEGLPLAELRGRLTQFEQRILTVVRQDSATQDSATQDSATQDSATQDSATQDSATQDSATKDSDAPATTTPTGTAVPGRISSAGSPAMPTGSAAESTSEAGQPDAVSETSAPAATTSPAEGSSASTTASTSTG